MKKSLIPKAAIATIAFALTASLAACGQSAAPDKGESSGEIPTIGISTIVSHPDLDSLIAGIQDGLKDLDYIEGENVKVEIENAQGDMALATTIAQKFVADKVDIIVGVSTPSSQAAVKAAENSSTAVVFTGVSAEPSEAGLAKPGNEPLGSLVTGVYSPDTTEEQLDLMGQLVPDLKRLGFIYNAGEANSVQAHEMVKAAAEARGWEIVDASVTSSNYVSAAMDSLIGKVDAVLLPQDNTVMTGLQALIEKASQIKMPLFPSDTSSVEEGALAAVATNTYEQGVQTAAVLVQMLEGTSADDIKPEPARNVMMWVNPNAAEAMGVTVPEAILAEATLVE